LPPIDWVSVSRWVAEEEIIADESSYDKPDTDSAEEKGRLVIDLAKETAGWSSIKL